MAFSLRALTFLLFVVADNREEWEGGMSFTGDCRKEVEEEEEEDDFLLSGFILVTKFRSVP
jgi:hypothetical protein